MAGKPLADIAEDVTEAGGVGDLPGPDPVDAGRTEVSIGAEQRRPTVEDLAAGVGRQQCQGALGCLARYRVICLERSMRVRAWRWIGV
jgi:hypothetical protein